MDKSQCNSVRIVT